MATDISASVVVPVAAAILVERITIAVEVLVASGSYNARTFVVTGGSLRSGECFLLLMSSS